MRISYQVEISYEDRPAVSIPLTAKTDKGAMRQAAKYLPREDGGKVFLHFHKFGNGEGYLDASGNACYPGRAWN